MKEIKSFDELCGIVDYMMTQRQQDKPLLIWFGGDVGRSNMLIDRFNKDYINLRFNDIQKENLGGVIKTTNKKAIVFHRYLNQMEEPFLRDVIESKQLSQKPVFVLANKYEYDNRPCWVADEFDEVIYNPIMRIVLIPCSKTKACESTIARDMYKGTLFKKSLAYAEKLNPDSIFILSDKYGLIPLDKCIEPYDKDIRKFSSKEKKEWGERVIEQMRSAGLDLEKDTFIVFAGEDYCEPLSSAIKDICRPLKGLRQGEQLRKLKQLNI